MQMAAALDSRTSTEQHQAETAELRRQLGCAKDEVAVLQKQVADASDHQSALVVELRRMAQQLSSGQMELEASRAIASAQRETILVREAEIARLESRIDLVQRGFQQSTRPGQPHASDCSVGPGNTVLSLPDTDLTGVSVASCLQPPAEMSSVGADRRDAGSTVELSVSIPHIGDSDLHVSENPDSLLAMWHQLQLNDSVRQSAGDSATATTSSRLPNTRSIADPPGPTSTRLCSALEEKTRVQNRIKALIGYREPAKKSAAVAKPRLSVRPQPLNHSKSSTTSTSLKQQRRTAASDASNTSQLSTAVSRYTATSSVDRLATS